MKLTDLLSKELILSDLQSDTKEGVLDEISSILTKDNPSLNKDIVTASLIEREKLGSTGIENGIAIPHAKIQSLKNILIAVGRSKKGIDFQAHDGKLSHLFFVLLAPNSSAGIHLQTLARLSRLLKDEGLRSKLMEAESEDEIYNVIKTEDDLLPC